MRVPIAIVSAAAIAASALGAIGAAPVMAAAAPAVHKVDNFVLKDQNQQSHELYKLTGDKAVVLITQMNGCPIVRNIMPALKKLRADYSPKGVQFLMLNASKQDSRDDIVAETKDWNIDFPILMDTTQQVAKKLGVTRTAEVIVINPKTWNVMYHGPVDDRVTYERQKAKADHTWAADALDATLAGKTVPVVNRQTQGCLINFD
jgi:peroxiredoxin